MHWRHTLRLNSKLLSCAAIFLLAFGVRVLSWHDTRLEVGKVQTVVSADYQHVARLLRDGGLRSFFSSASPLADLNTLGHPPGYSILIALIYTLFGESDAAIQFVQIFADAIAAALILLIVAELFPLSAGVIAGLLAALSPQFAWNSVLLLPDSISVLPILISILLLVRAIKHPRLVTFVIIGALIGISCWLRANAMLLTVYVAAAVPVLMWKKKEARRMRAARRQDAGAPVMGASVVAQVWRFALAVVFGTLLIVLPLTIRNAIVFHRFIPLSLGAGQTLLEGIADYDARGRFGVPPTDMGIMKQESEMFQRPDYYGTLFNPDGVERERARLSRGFAIIGAHPLWFAGVMTKRASSMMRLERARLIASEPAIDHAIDSISQMKPVWSGSPDKVSATGALLSHQAQTSLVSDTCCWLTLMGDSSRYGDQFASPMTSVRKNVDYVLVVPIRAISGRMRVSVRSSTGGTYSSAIVEAFEVSPDNDLQRIALPFVAPESEKLQVVFSNEASNSLNPVVSVTELELYELGPSRFLWTRYPRFVIHGVQKIFITAVMLPLAIVGLLFVIFQKKSIALVVLSIVPIYFFTVQSMVHTEYRYVLAVTYFLLAFAAVGISHSARAVVKILRRTRRKQVQYSH
jgi:hypothetical protein